MLGGGGQRCRGRTGFFKILYKFKVQNRYDNRHIPEMWPLKKVVAVENRWLQVVVKWAWRVLKWPNVAVKNSDRNVLKKYAMQLAYDWSPCVTVKEIITQKLHLLEKGGGGTTGVQDQCRSLCSRTCCTAGDSKRENLFATFYPPNRQPS